MNDVQLLIIVHVSGYKAPMGTTKRKHREALQRRKSILAAARQVFWRKGYAGATVAEIAEMQELNSQITEVWQSSKVTTLAQLAAMLNLNIELKSVWDNGKQNISVEESLRKKMNIDIK